MVEIDIPKLTELSNDMDEIQYWFTIAMYVVFGIFVLIILLVLYRILCCGVCLVKGVYSPFGCLCNRKKEERLLPKDGDPITRRSFV